MDVHGTLGGSQVVEESYEVSTIRPMVIVVEKAQILPGCFRHSIVHSIALTVTNGSVWQLEKQDIVKLLLEFLIPGQIGSGRAVDNNNDFLFAKRLFEYGLQGRQKKVRPVAGGYDDGEERGLILRIP